jgi:glycerol kinase
MGGAIMQWLRDQMGILPDISNSQKIAQSIPDTHGATIVPAFTGLGAPYWDAEARGIITGLTRGVTANHLIRAATESMAFQVHDVLQAMAKDTHTHIHSLIVDGGAARDAFLLQFQADISEARIHRGEQTESTALGAALLAGLEGGVWQKPEEALEHHTRVESFSPKMAKDSRKRNLQRWETAIRQVRK